MFAIVPTLVFVFWISTAGGATELVNSTSPLFGSTTILTDDAVKATYQKVLSCLSRSQLISSLSAPPVSDLEAHYSYLLKETERFRGVPIHDHGPFLGPWIENYWIDKFMSQPFSTFNGLVPLFVQWVDIHVYSFRDQNTLDPKIPEHAKMAEYFKALLRKDVMYITVSQDDQGIGLALTHEYPNILVLSAGGYGHVPIPLIKGDIPYAAPPSNGIYTYQAGFYGLLRHRMSRHTLIMQLAQGLQRYGIRTEMIERHPDWVSNMQKTLINFAPRGFGRTSYRLAEIIQCGRIPVYMYDDIEWLPYGDTNISVKSFGFSGRMGSLNSVADRVSKLLKDPSAVQLTLETVKAVRHHYTYEGVIEQIAMFLTDPFGHQGGNLACARLPRTDHRL